MHTQKTVFSTQNSKNFPPSEGIPPPTPSPLVTNTLFNKNGSPSPLVLQSYTFRARFDVNSKFITHPIKCWFLVPKFPKIPHRPPPTPSPSVVSHTQITQKELLALPPPPPPPPPPCEAKCIAQTYLTFRAKMRNSGKHCCAPKRKWSRTPMYVLRSSHKLETLLPLFIGFLMNSMWFLIFQWS